MNIGQVLRSLIGELQPSGPKTLELKAGEVVRGVVLQQLPDQEALLNIGGVQVRARLETPLKTGEATMLQVQPESVTGQIVLKPLTSSTVPLTEESAGKLLKEFGLSDSTANRQAVVLLQKEGMDISRESVRTFLDVLGNRPEGADEAEWKQAALVALKKGLPLTAETVSGLQKVIFGQPLHESLQRLGEQTSQLLAGLRGTGKEEWANLARQIGRLLEQMPGLTDAGKGVPAGRAPSVEGSAASAAAWSSAGSAEEGPLAAGRGFPAAGASPAAMTGAVGAERASAGGGTPAAAGGAASLPGGTPAPPAGGGAPAGQAGGPAQAAAAGDAGSAAATAGALPVPGPSPAPGSAPLAEGQAAFAKPNAQEQGRPLVPGALAALQEEPLQQVSPADSRAAQTQTPPAVIADSSSDGGWIGKLLKHLGVEHEHQLAQFLGTRGDAGAGASPSGTTGGGAAALPSGINHGLAQASAHANGQQGLSNEAAEGQSASSPVLNNPGKGEEITLSGANGRSRGIELHQPNAAGVQHPDTAKPPVADTLKGLLLGLASLDDTPLSLKETAQHVLQQITGQQLLLTPDRNPVFTHMTMMIPLRNEAGDQTASVHIQSRRRKEGGIDASNCRLVFDLKMQAMGNMMVDVQVYDRIVSLQVHNDHPAAAVVMDSMRDDIQSGLGTLGYQFLSLKCVPYPEKHSEETAAGSPETMEADGARGAGTGWYSAKPYKGMDLRI